MNRILQRIRLHIPQTIGLAIVLTAVVYLLATTEIRFLSDRGPEGPLISPTGEINNSLLGHSALPDSRTFTQVAETDYLILHVDESSGHFTVEDKRNGEQWNSFPDPEHWENETIQGVWKEHLRSPIMIQTLNLEVHNSRPKIANWITDNGTIADFTRIEGGVRLTYILTQSAISIPVQIRIKDDYLETKIEDEAIIEGADSLLWIRLFSFFGAEHNVGQEGYMLVPDGSGAIISLKGISRNENRLYKEPIYGQDMSYFTGDSSRLTVRMPVFGLKTENRGFISVVEEGAEYADVIASPAGVYSSYNWVSTEMRYRSPFQQVTNRSNNTKITTYDKDAKFESTRTTRYYLLDGEQSSYAGMASRYRQYLMEEQGYERIAPVKNIPLQLTVIGGERESGVLTDRYIPMTTSSQAMEMVQQLYGMGVENMSINLLGWQEGGFSSFGKILPVDSRLGGNEGVGHFIDFAQSLGIPVSYGVNYFLNNSGGNGFSERYHAMQDLMGKTLNFSDWYDNKIPIVSHRYVEKYFADDLQQLRRLGFNGITFGQGYWYGGGLGRYLLSDHNSRYATTRKESMEVQERLFTQAEEVFDQVNGTSSGQFVNKHVDHIFNMEDDYSYDLFSERSVPFMQIALHGLLTYSSYYVNEREELTSQLLRDLEYGALPGFIFSHEPTYRLKHSYGLQLFNTQYEQWVEEAVKQYQIYNQAHHDVQDQFIVNHRMLSNGVFETTFENGKQIIVNYGSTPYSEGSIRVKGKDYLIVEGGEQ